MIAAIVVAAGKGVRMGLALPKQFLSLQGIPLLCHSIRSLSFLVDRLILVVAEQDISYCRDHVLVDQDLPLPVEIVAGGAQRQDSVFCGLSVLGPEDRWVVIHDGVRPFVPIKALQQCIQLARKTGACIVGMPAIDTLKRVNDLGLIQVTLDRAGIWQAQTPQVFRTELVLQAHRKARTEGYSGTDDASLVEWMGHPVSMVQGSRYNIKITTPEDLRVAEAIYRLQETA